MEEEDSAVVHFAACVRHERNEIFAPTKRCIVAPEPSEVVEVRVVEAVVGGGGVRQEREAQRRTNSAALSMRRTPVTRRKGQTRTRWHLRRQMLSPWRPPPLLKAVQTDLRAWPLWQHKRDEGFLRSWR